jgi:3-phenylpropionate/trans-cinnamate dioxygenase ferredoxin subunit
MIMREDGFIPVFEEKKLQDNTFEEIGVQDIPILLIKNNGEVFAVVNQCPHQGNSLAWDGGYILSCTRGACAHMAFDIRTGINVDFPDSDIKLERFDCKIDDGKIWIRLSK